MYGYKLRKTEIPIENSCICIKCGGMFIDNELISYTHSVSYAEYRGYKRGLCDDCNKKITNNTVSPLQEQERNTLPFGFIY